MCQRPAIAYGPRHRSQPRAASCAGAWSAYPTSCTRARPRTARASARLDVTRVAAAAPAAPGPPPAPPAAPLAAAALAPAAQPANTGPKRGKGDDPDGIMLEAPKKTKKPKKKVRPANEFDLVDM